MAGDNDEEFSRGDFTVSGRRALSVTDWCCLYQLRCAGMCGL